MTRTGEVSPSRGCASPNRSSSATRCSSTRPAYRVGCLVSIAISTRCGCSTTSWSSRSRVSTRCAPSRRRSGYSAYSSLAAAGCFQEPKSSCRSCASSSVETTPRPLEVRLTRRSCTHTSCMSAVRRTSHSRPSRALQQRGLVRGQRVLRHVLGRAAVGDDGDLRSRPAGERGTGGAGTQRGMRAGLPRPARSGAVRTDGARSGARSARNKSFQTNPAPGHRSGPERGRCSKRLHQPFEQRTYWPTRRGSLVVSS